MKKPLQLEVIGSFALSSGDGTPIAQSSRRAMVLLALLASAQDHSLSRNELRTTLWSTRSDPQSRDSLRQTLSALRKNALLRDALAVSRDRVALIPDRWQVDLWRFDEQVANQREGNPALIAELYRGEFLAGVKVHDPVCTEWLSRQRQWYRDRAVDALHRLMASQLSRDLHSEANCTARRLSDLGVADVQRVVEPAPETIPSKPVRHAHWRRASSLVTATTVAALFAGLALWPSPPRDSSLDDKHQVFISDLRGEKESSPTATSISRELHYALANQSQLEAKSVSGNSRRRIATLTRGYTLTGSLRDAGSASSINLRLIDNSNGELIWNATQTNNGFPVQANAIASRFADEVAATLKPQRIEERKFGGTHSTQAYRAFQRGWIKFQRYTADDNAAALRDFQTALEFDPITAEPTRQWL